MELVRYLRAELITEAASPLTKKSAITIPNSLAFLSSTACGSRRERGVFSVWHEHVPRMRQQGCTTAARGHVSLQSIVWLEGCDPLANSATRVIGLLDSRRGPRGLCDVKREGDMDASEEAEGNREDLQNDAMLS
eukprot:1180427-Prorocentrum_minimum.AAC.7